MTTTSYRNSTEQRALALAARSATWSRGTARTVNGALVAVNLFTSESDPGTVWLTRVDGAGCSCPGAQKSRSGVCCHMRACALVTERARERIIQEHEAACRAEASGELAIAF